MSDEPDGFQSLINVEVSATVTHPPGTKFDADGKPIPPEDDYVQTKGDA